VPPGLLVDVYALLLGLIVGSYLNVVIHRLPRGRSTVTPRSRCPACGTPIRARDNLPLVSWLLLRGRCRSCGAPISVRYPLVEGVTGLLFLACAERFGLSGAALAGFVFCALLVALAGIDYDHYTLPDRLTVPGIALGLAAQPFLPWGGFVPALLAAAAGGALLVAVWGIWYLVRREHGIGLGDAKMLAMIGAFLGWKGMAVAFVAATAAGAAVGLAALAAGRLGRRGKLPFGVFLAAGGVVGLLWGQRLADAYLELL
jgi:leader peptidase (prepilin peptidase)/N-methyltransferase